MTTALWWEFVGIFASYLDNGRVYLMVFTVYQCKTSIILWVNKLLIVLLSSW
jgi:hypothetical protein